MLLNLDYWMLNLDYWTEIFAVWFLHCFLLQFIFRELHRHLVIYLDHLWELGKPVSPISITLVSVTGSMEAMCSRTKKYVLITSSVTSGR